MKKDVPNTGGRLLLAHAAIGRMLCAGRFDVVISPDDRSEGWWVELTGSQATNRPPRTFYLEELELVEGDGASSRPCWVNEGGIGSIHVDTEHALVFVHLDGIAGKRVRPEVSSGDLRRASSRVTAGFWLRLYASSLAVISLETLTLLSRMSRSTVYKFLTDETASGHLRRVTRSSDSPDPFPRARLFEVTTHGLGAWLLDIETLWPRYRISGKWPKRQQPPIDLRAVRRLERSVFGLAEVPHVIPGQAEPVKAWVPTGGSFLKKSGMLHFSGISQVYFSESAWNDFIEEGAFSPVSEHDLRPTTLCTVVADRGHLIRLFSAEEHGSWKVRAANPHSAGHQQGDPSGQAHHGTTGSWIEVPARPGILQALRIIDALHEGDARTSEVARSAWRDYTRPFDRG